MIISYPKRDTNTSMTLRNSCKIFIPQIAIAIGVLTLNRGGGRRTTLADWTWHQGAIVGCSVFPEYIYGRNGNILGWYPTALLSDQPAIGAWALLHSLVKAPWLNAQRGQVVGLQQSRMGSRWQIRLTDGKMIAVTEKNLRFSTSEEHLFALGTRKIIMTCHPDNCCTNDCNYLLELAILLRSNR